jgi:hypothetical protein
MMHPSQLRLAILSVFVLLVSACGSSGGSEQAAGSSAETIKMAVSATPQPDSAASPKDLSKIEPVVRPGAEAPLDSVPDSISKHVGSMLFSTGFEEGVALERPDSKSAYQQLVGSDRPGYSFPITLGSAQAQWPSLVLADVGMHINLPPSYFAQSAIKTVVDRNGGPTRALSLQSKSFSRYTQEISVGSSGLSKDPVVFQRMWVKFDERTLERANGVSGGRFYQTFWEVKGQAESWLRLKLQSDGAGGLVWVAKGNGLAGAQSYWADSLATAPVTIAPESSASGWHKVEIWLDPDAGRFKVAIDGQTLVDRAGVLVGNGGEWIKNFRMMMVASSVAPLAEVLFDDVEFWDLPPADAFAPAALPQ